MTRFRSTRRRLQRGRPYSTAGDIATWRYRAFEHRNEPLRHGAGDVIAVGKGNVIIHYDGIGWSPVRNFEGAATADFLTVTGSENLVLIGDSLGNVHYLDRRAPWD